MRLADINDSMWELLFSVRISIRYHDARKRFFAFLHRSTAATGVIMGSAAIAALLGEAPQALGLAAAALVTLACAADLVVGFAPAANTHHELRQRYIDLEAAMIAAHDDEQLGDYQRRKLLIERDEPPVRQRLAQRCYNDLVQAEYPSDAAGAHQITLPWWKRATAHIA